MKEIYQNSDEFSRLQDTPPVESDVFSPAGDTAPASEFYIPQGEDFAEIPPVTEKKKSEETSKSTLQKLVRRMGYLVAASVATVSLGSTVKLNVSTTPGGESDYATAYVCDAENRAALDANITIYDESGKNIGTVHSKGSAGYVLDLEPGEYRAEVTSPGFLSLSQTFYQDYNGPVQQVFALTGQLKPGQMRIVLQWGISPSDLDSHLYNQDEHLAYYSSELTRYDNNGVGTKIAYLDVDDTSSYGPETVTIYDTRGSFIYSVYDFSSGGYYSTMAEESHATVQVYTYGSARPQTFEIPHSTGNECTWQVFRLDNGRITVLNKLVNEAPGDEFNTYR